MSYGQLRSTALVGAGRWEAAIEEATRELGTVPGDPEVLFNRGQALAALGRAEEAARDLEAALAMDASASALDPAALDDELFSALRSVAVSRRDRPAEAVAILERYRTLLPEGRHVADLPRWIDHVRGIDQVWYRDRV